MTVSLAMWVGASKWLDVVGLIGALWADPPLSAESQAWLEPSVENLRAEDNLYYHVLGFDAPADGDPVARGQSVHAALVAAEARSSTWSDFDYVEPAGDALTLTLSEAVSPLCLFRERGCLDSMRERRAEIDAAAHDHAVLLARYRVLGRMPDMQTLAPAHLMVSFAVPPIDVTKAHHLNLATIAVEPDLTHATALPADEIAASRRLLGAADELLMKAVAIAWLGNDLKLYAQLLDNGSQRHALRPISELLTPLSDDEWRLDGALRREFRINARVYRTLVDEPLRLAPGVHLPSVVNRITFKPNATINLHQHAMAEVIRRTRVTPRARKTGEPLIGSPTPIQWLTNSNGWLMVEIGSAAYFDYGDRLRDLDGLIRLVELKRDLLDQVIDDAHIPAWLTSRGAKWRDPYTGEPMRWDADARRLYFQGYGTTPAFREVFLPSPASL